MNQGPRFSQPAISDSTNVQRAPPGVCEHWYSNSVCPRRPCPLRHVVPADPLPSMSTTDKSRTSMSGASEGPPAFQRLAPPRPPASVAQCRVVPVQAPLRAQQVNRDENVSMSTGRQRATLQAPRPAQAPPSTTATASNLPSPPKLSRRTVPPTAGPSGASISAPPGLPAPVKSSVDGDFTKEGLFTAEQALPASREVSSTKVCLNELSIVSLLSLNRIDSYGIILR